MHFHFLGRSPARKKNYKNIEQILFSLNMQYYKHKPKQIRKKYYSEKSYTAYTLRDLGDPKFTLYVCICSLLGGLLTIGANQCICLLEGTASGVFTSRSQSPTLLILEMSTWKCPTKSWTRVYETPRCVCKINDIISWVNFIADYLQHA